DHEQPADNACCIYATAPFVQPEDLIAAYRRLVGSNMAYVFSVTTYSFPIQRALQRHADGSVEPLYPQYSETRSQDLENIWHDAAQFYWGNAHSFLNQIPVYARSTIGFPIPRYRVQDIDTPEDWTHAELMYEALKHQAQQ
ncbi:MAG: pseudaminic acid cytidylyltransferase, partial [Anaerolineae bacterium]|nr:pseudaminic acid cytidylyltransferase [Anaerolineae bacterium]